MNEPNQKNQLALEQDYFEKGQARTLDLFKRGDGLS